jgi:hypothetical protein
MPPPAAPLPTHDDGRRLFTGAGRPYVAIHTACGGATLGQSLVMMNSGCISKLS